MGVDFNYPYQVSVDTPAVANEVQDNFNDLLTWIKTYYRQVDDTPKLTAMLELPGDPTQPNHAVPLSYLDQVFPTGFIAPYAGGPTDNVSPAGEPVTVPTGWAVCDGTSQATTGAYADLFAVIGYRYGGSGGNFNLPDLRVRAPVGRQAGNATFGDVGNAGGEADPINPSHFHSLTTGGEHTHSINLTHNGSVEAHTHAIDHDHPTVAVVTAINVGTHGHVTSIPAKANMNAGGSTDFLMRSNSTGTSSPLSVQSGSNNGGHQHSLNVNLPNLTGTSGSTAPTLTVDDHIDNTGSAGPSSTDSTGEADVTNKNYQPYVVMNYLIKT